MPEFLQYGFMVRALWAGAIVAVVAPVIGLFLVLRRYSLMADTLAHVSLAGVGAGMLVGLPPGVGAVLAAVAGAVGVEQLRVRQKLYGEVALALFLSGSLALALILMALAGGLDLDLFSYLFGSIVTVTPLDLALMAGLGGLVLLAVAAAHKELFAVTLDEEAAAVAGLPVAWLNAGFAGLAAVTVALTLRVVGVLLVSALMVIPAVASLQVATSFRSAVGWSVGFALVSAEAGLVAAYYLDLPAGAAIVAVALGIFGLTSARRWRKGDDVPVGSPPER